MRTTLLLSIGIAFVVAIACADLPTIDPGQCGNEVLEPGEDCDGFPAADSGPGSCIAQGQPGECHFSCDPAAPVTGCPSTFSCGADSICRRPSGTFHPPLAVAGEASKNVLVGDFDGDHAGDVVAVGTTVTRIYFFDGQSQPKPLALASSSNRAPALGNLASDGRTSAVVVSPIVLSSILTTNVSAYGGDLRVWRGSADRTLLPTIYPTLDLGSYGLKGGRMVPVFVGGLGSEIMAIGTGAGLGAGEYGLFDVAGQGPVSPTLVTKSLASPDTIIGEIPTATLGDGSVSNGFTLCDAIVLAYPGATSVTVLPTCTNSGAINYASSPDHIGPDTYNLGATITGRSFLVPVPSATNSRTNYDLFVATDALPRGLLKLAGQADGTFAAPVGVPIALTKPSDVLALGYVNSDAYVDWVSKDGIHVYGVPFATPPLDGSSWTDARLDDFNKNGLTDVVGISSTGLDFFNGSGIGVENGLHVPIDGTPQELAVGDFDGDFVTDFAMTTTGDSTGLTSNGLIVSFGALSAFPQAPVSIGRLDSIQQLSPAFFDYRINGTPDFVSTLFAIGNVNGSLVASTLQGSPDRLINSPFFLGASEGAIAIAAVGDFANTGHAGVAGLALKLGTPPAIHLWSVPAVGDAQLDATQVVEQKAATAIDPQQVSGAALVALDIGGAPGEELVGLAPNGPPNSGSIPGAFAVAALTGTDWSVLDAETLTAYPVRDGGTVVVLARDVDGDGHSDLILAYRDADASQGGHFIAKVIFNGMTGNLKLSDAVDLSVPDGTMGVTTAHISLDGGTSVIAVSRDGVFAAPVNGRTFGAFAPVAPVQTSDAGEVVQPSDITTGDVDGDGVDDVIVGTSTGFLVYFGIPAVAQ